MKHFRVLPKPVHMVGQLSDDVLPVRAFPSFDEIHDVAGLDDEILNCVFVIVLEDASFRNMIGFDRNGFVYLDRSGLASHLLSVSLAIFVFDLLFLHFAEIRRRDLWFLIGAFQPGYFVF